MSALYLPKVSRRTTLQWLAVGLRFVRPLRASTGKLIVFSPTAKGYGTDPQLNHPLVTWNLIMEPHQLQQTAVLADMILPASETASAPSMVGVPDFVNEWISAPYPDQLDDRKIILDGLQWTDAEANWRWHHGFLETDDETRRQIVADIAKKNADPAMPPQMKFFQRFRFLVVGAYYTTPDGFNDIGYSGNIPLTSYPPMAEEERAILERALSALGL
jgi:Gluconate 2-dehydrogenase subunit 3